MIRKLLVLFSVLALFVAACSDSDDDKSDDVQTGSDDDGEGDDALAFDDWVDEVNQICLDYQDRNDEIDAAIDEAGDDVEAQVEVMDDGLALFEEQVDEIEAVGTPDDNADLVDEAIAALRDQLDLLQDFRDAVEDENEDALSELPAQLEEQEQITDDYAEELGVKDCGSEDAGSDENGGDAGDAGPNDVDDSDTGSGGGSGDLGLDDLGTIREEGITEMMAEGLDQDQAECFVDYVLDNVDAEMLGLIVTDEPIDATNEEALAQFQDLLRVMQAASVDCDIPPELLGLDQFGN